MDEASLTIALLGLSALIGMAFVGAEAGIHALGELRLRALREEGGPHAHVAERVLREDGRLFARLQVGRTLGLVGATLAFAHMARLPLNGGLGALFAAGAFIPEETGAGWSSLVIATSMFLLGYLFLQQLVSSLVRRYADEVGLVWLRFLRPLEFLIWPVSLPFEWIGYGLDRPTGRESIRHQSGRLVELEVEQAIALGREEGALTNEHAALLRSALEFKHTKAREAMVPRRRIVAFEMDTPLHDVLQVIRAEGHSRYPVYREKLDQIEGTLVAKNLLKALSSGNDLEKMSIEDFVSGPAFFCDESRLVGPLLREMQARRSHMAMVVDEFGGTIGLITLEDVLEEIVGEIQDEDDVEEDVVREVAPGRYVVDADVSLDDVEEYLGERLHDETGEFDSVGGLLIEKAGRVPTVGESVQAGDFNIVVQGANPKHVSRVEIIRRVSSSADS